ncbi:hypothetical protein E2C01_074695 [Portunus trituberculatus]|uniref:Uncharacterized protein n=1 Tax=Portunus trituberculatus TaxID=210409 RepID=A0A5B7IEY9_PORTR|nr:hypothetical protein [Portunus trituberculatus]
MRSRPTLEIASHYPPAESLVPIVSDLQARLRPFPHQACHIPAREDTNCSLISEHPRQPERDTNLSLPSDRPECYH